MKLSCILAINPESHSWPGPEEGPIPGAPADRTHWQPLLLMPVRSPNEQFHLVALALGSWAVPPGLPGSLQHFSFLTIEADASEGFQS
jgi:hypothetical protein